jgi:asparagine N-glycosylation enzyme membrane subunit Stt3
VAFGRRAIRSSDRGNPHAKGVMSDPGPAPRRKSAFTLARELIGGVRTLAGLEVRQARAEMSESLGHVKGGAISFAIAAAIVVAFAVMLLATIVATLFVVGLWWVDLILLVVMLLIAGLLVWRGVRQVRQVKVKPEQTIASVKEDLAWAKRLIKRG